jgi:two-component system CheB/CheR fusion protein
VTEEPNKDFEELLEYLKTSRGFDFTGYKRPSLMRRVERRLAETDVKSFADYLDHLQVHPEEFAQLFNTILINVTSFFRDPHAWEYIEKEVVPKIAGHGKGPIRIWSAGTASGEEAYTIAMLLFDALDRSDFQQRVKIYATDVDEEALTMARQGRYPAKDLEDVPESLRERHLEQIGSRFAFRAELRRAIIFGRHDLVQDAPISRLSMVICRNALMYFNADAQASILERLHFALNDEGFLFLGKAEMLLSHSKLFTPVSLKDRVFAKVPRRGAAGHVPRLALPETAEFNLRLHEVAVDAGPEAALLVDTGGILVAANQQARAMFGLSPNDIGRPLQDLEVSYRPADLRSLIDQANTERQTIRSEPVIRRRPGAEPEFLEVLVSPLFDFDGTSLGVSVTFTDISTTEKMRLELERSKQDLESAYEELQSTNEELETTNEELQSTVEELETTNEELQSTNEELETMNEELQSTNAEIHAVNDEMSERSDELQRINAFSESIIGALSAGVIVVNEALEVQRWNAMSQELWGLASDEVVGEPLSRLDIGLPVAEVAALAHRCLDGNPPETATLPAVNRRGQKISIQVSCTPIATPGRVVMGAVILVEPLG